MLLFTLFTLGYFAGVFTALAMFPPRTKEIEMQEFNTQKPILDTESETPAVTEKKSALTLEF